MNLLPLHVWLATLGPCVVEIHYQYHVVFDPPVVLVFVRYAGRSWSHCNPSAEVVEQVRHLVHYAVAGQYELVASPVVRSADINTRHESLRIVGYKIDCNIPSFLP